MSSALPELRSYLESLPEPHILFDDRYRILAANGAYLKQFGTQASVIGRTCYEVSHHFHAPCDQCGESCPMSLAKASGQRERVLHLHHTPKGEAYVNIELVPLSNADGEQVYFIEKMEALNVAKGTPVSEGLVGRSVTFRDMLELATRVGPSNATVLLLGESGTGKELVARAVHEASKRSQSPLVVVECASLTETLFESELFGHERGAFTGANTAKAGLVESASGGTLFLDEVGDIPLSMQVKLLRLLESGTYRRVGGTELRRCDIRVISATHRDLQAMVASGRFREDLYYRLSAFPIGLPPLRERADDIPLLANALLARVADGRTLRLSQQALDRLTAYAFPGNIRELRNVLERAALLCDGDVVDLHHIERSLSTDARRALPARTSPGSLVSPAIPVSPGASGDGRSLREVENEVLMAHLQHHQGSRAELASKLGISTRSLYRKLKAIARGD